MDGTGRLKCLLSCVGPGLEAHHRRVARYAERIAGIVCPEQSREITLAASIHDVGKIGIPDEILLKPGRLTRSEWDFVRLHPVIGAQILKRSGGRSGIDGGIIAAVTHHHERWDGLGYPAGLKGTDIPLPSRILAVADAFDAMTSVRPYRAPLAREDALQELERHAGTQFDPEIVGVFLNINAGRVDEERGAAALRDVALSGGGGCIVHGETEEQLFALLVDTGDPYLREAACVELIRRATTGVLEGFIRLLSSPEAHLRNLAVEALQELGAGHIDRLEKLLYDPDPDIRLLTFNILAAIRSEKAAEPVRRFLLRLVSGGVDEPPNVLAAALECLGALGGRDDAALLDQLAGIIERRGRHPYLGYALRQARNGL